MSTAIKKINKNIIETSDVINIHNTSLIIIKNKIKTREAMLKKKGRKDAILVRMMLLLFTAVSVFKNIIDLVSKNFSQVDWVLLILIVAVVVLVLVFEFKGDKNE